MRYFPIFLDAKDRRAVVFGGGEAVLNKVRLLRKAGARVEVFAGEAVEGLNELARAGEISLSPAADPATFDFAEAALVVSSAGDPVDAVISARAMALGIPVNVVDRTELCSFITPAIVDRGTVLAAIGTEGAAPVLARRLRAKFEAMLPARLGDLADLIGSRRERLSGETVNVRRAFWESVVDGPIGAAALAGRADEAAEALDALIDGKLQDEQPTGVVYLVGAGPGDPELLTLKALRILQDADIIFHDDLVTPEVLDLARRDAERVFVGKRAGEKCIAQRDINTELVAAARRGLRVVRLKGGDPFVFGRGGEEVEALVKAGIAVEVVPGVTAALGCAASAGIPLTHRDHAQACVLVTGHLKDGSVDLDWQMLSRPRQTVVIYMGMGALQQIAAQLIAHGLPASTPVALIEHGTTERERRVVGTLATIEGQAQRAHLTGPTLCMVGEVVGLALSRDQEFTFESRMGL